jgi:hypothetical protein
LTNSLGEALRQQGLRGVARLARRPRRLLVLVREMTGRQPFERLPIPPWLNADFRRRPSTREAMRQYFQSRIARSRAENVRRVLTSTANIAASHAMRITMAALRVRAASPLVDARVIELAAALPARLRTGPLPKSFLRMAARGKLPADVLSQNKDDSMYSLLYRQGLSRLNVADALADVQRCAPLQGLLRVDALREALLRRQHLPAARAEQLVALVRLARWHGRLALAYGA